MTPEQEQEITRLRGLSLSPKQIARQIGLRPYEVSALIQAQAAQLHQSDGMSNSLAPLHHCLINGEAARYLLDRSTRQSEDERGLGLAQLFVTRLTRGDYLVCGYLIDYWCLGVKSTFGPRKMDTKKYRDMVRTQYEKFEEGYREITLAQAQGVIFGGLDYATRLGFKPDPDFEQSKITLGERPEQLIDIEFGRNGKPFYISGPYDNTNMIIETLERSVGSGNYNYIFPVQ
jgi:hypothetical protein